MINSSWPWRSLGELFEIDSGKTMSAVARSGNNKTPFLRTSNVFWDEIDLSSVDEMSIPEHELPTKLLQQGDLLVCEGGEIGRAAIWNGEVKTMSFQNHLHRLRPIVKGIEPRFYVYFLQSAFTQLGIFEGAGNKTTIPNLSRNQLATLSVPQPTLDEQLSITIALARVRELIRTHARNIECAQDLKGTTMQKLFTQGLWDEPQKQTEVGPMPENWAVMSVAEAVKPLRFGASVKVPKSDYSEIGRWPIIDQGQEFIAGYVDDESRVIHPESPVIIFGDHTRIFKFVDFSFTLGADGTKPLLATDGFIPKYLYYALCNLKIQSRGYNRHYTVLREMLVGKPSVSEQHEIVDILDAIDHKINLHQKKRANFNDLFKTLLHQLMTGKIHTTDLNI